MYRTDKEPHQHSLIGATVEFQVEQSSFGLGVVVAVSEEEDSILVEESDGCRWRGSMDLVEVIKNSEQGVVV